MLLGIVLAVEHSLWKGLRKDFKLCSKIYILQTGLLMIVLCTTSLTLNTYTVALLLVLLPVDRLSVGR